MKRAFLIMFSFLIPIIWGGLVEGESLSIKTEEKILDNGLKVIVVEDHTTPTVTFQIWYRVGSMDESFGKTGISHLLEHMMFKGTDKYGPGQFSKIVASNGGQENAFTGKDYTAYFENWGSGEKIDISMELESDRMVNLKLLEDEFKREKMVVMEERRLRTEDEPVSVLVEEVMAATYRAHPYHWPIIGWMKDIENITLEDLKAHYRNYYCPNNAVIVVVGDVKAEEVFERASRYFGSIKRCDLPRRVEFEEPDSRGEKRLRVKHKEAKVPTLFGVFLTPNGKSQDSYALRVLSLILGEGKSSRLYRRLVLEEKKAVSVETEYDPIARGGKVPFSIYIVPAPNVSLDEVEGIFWQEVERIKREGLKQDELEKAKNKVIASFIYGLDSNFYRAMLIGMLEVCGFKLDYINSYVDNISKITSDDIKRVAERYLVRDNFTVGYLIPEGEGYK